MTQKDAGRYLVIPVGLSGLIGLWLSSVLLIAWTTMGGPEVASRWGLLCSVGAAAWTMLYGLTRWRRLLVEAFELGRSSVHRVK